MVTFRSFLALTVAAGAALALPTSNQFEERNVAAVASPEPVKRANRALFERLGRKRDARAKLLDEQNIAKRDGKESPIVPYPDLTALSDKPGGQNYTGYKNPQPANKPGTDPQYAAYSAFDWHSLNLVTHQEYIELDLFNYIVSHFTPEEFHEWGITDDDVSLLQFFGQQEIGHALVISNLLGEKAPYECTYQYDFHTVGEALLFSEKVTRWGESGVYGFLPSLDNRATAQILLQSITTEARQEYTQRQLLGLQPSPVWFETGAPQAWAWTLLSPWIKSCPSHNTPVEWSIFPKLNITNNPDPIAAGKTTGAGISHNHTALSNPGDYVHFAWNADGEVQGPYHQLTEILSEDKIPRYTAWVSQYNVSYSPLEDVKQTSPSSWTGQAKIPAGYIFPENGTQSIINETVFVALTNDQTKYSPLNLSQIIYHTIAGPALYFAD